MNGLRLPLKQCDMGPKRLQFIITGQVQGVGFRPHVYRIAHLLGFTGWVQNNSFGVLIEIQGVGVGHFISELHASLPPLARIDKVQTKEITFSSSEEGFHIIESEPGNTRAMISPDTCICNQCLHELFDPHSRYYQYPFLNCTHCGPRLTITRTLPYDREQTSMDAFPMCAACLQDYSDPKNRRYHAQPTACADCGPKLSLPLTEIAQSLRDGKIIALKNLGGYQLLCDARNPAAIATLRSRKKREAKPFALMVVNAQSATCYVEASLQELQLLRSPSRPIVLLRQKAHGLPQSIAPGLSHLGMMLPATPLHYLLFNALCGFRTLHEWLDEAQSSILVVTSANLSGQPLIIDDDVAHQDLSSIADVIVSYNRKIVTRADDSVVRVIKKTPHFIRRARGFVPERIKLAHPIPATLALGAHLKNTFCITRGDEAFVSQHIGNLTNKATIAFFRESLTHWMRFLNVNIERIACDLHPDFYTTQLAEELHLEQVPVQHHHAHLASVAAEHRILEKALGLALDGYGYGNNGEWWGGELFLLEGGAYAERLGNLLPLPLPSGEITIREPWRMAASVLHQLGRNHEIVQRFAPMPQAPMLANLFASQWNIPLTSSCGRWFDAASALLGIKPIAQYEGQAAILLENLVTEIEVLPDGWYVENHQFSMLPTFARLLDVHPIRGANVFHGTLIAGLAEWVKGIAEQTSTHTILLSGGCFMNKVLSEGLSHRLSQSGLRVYLPQRLPPNDGGLSLGQAWIAGNKRI